jgi:hypothetical protein
MGPSRRRELDASTPAPYFGNLVKPLDVGLIQQRLSALHASRRSCIHTNNPNAMSTVTEMARSVSITRLHMMYRDVSTLPVSVTEVTAMRSLCF